MVSVSIELALMMDEGPCWEDPSAGELTCSLLQATLGEQAQQRQCWRACLSGDDKENLAC